MVDLQAVLAADIIEIVHTLAVFPIVCGIYFYNGMEALLSGMDQACHRKFQFPDQRMLLVDLHAV